MLPLLLLGCLPSPLDPVAEPTVPGEPPPPARDAERKEPTRAAMVVRRNASDPIAYAARGQPPAAVAIEGGRVTVTEVKWQKVGREGDVVLFRLPNPFVAGVTVTDIAIDGAACPLAEAPTAPQTCAIRDGVLTYAAAPKGATLPKTLAFTVDEAVAAREAELRGKNTWTPAFSPVAYTLEGFEKPVLSPQAAGIQLMLQQLPANSVLRFEPTVVPSPLFGPAEGARYDLEIISVRKGENPRTLLTLAVPDQHPVPVELRLGEEDESYVQLTLRMNRTPENRLGPILVLADAEIGK